MTAAQEHWARCRPWIVAALAKCPGFEDIQDVEARIEKGIYQFWPGDKAAVVTEIVNFARLRAINVTHCGGDMDEIMGPLQSRIHAYGLTSGCQIIMGGGVEGWKRTATKHGYKFGWLVMFKELKE